MQHRNAREESFHANNHDKSALLQAPRCRTIIIRLQDTKKETYPKVCLLFLFVKQLLVLNLNSCTTVVRDR